MKFETTHTLHGDCEECKKLAARATLGQSHAPAGWSWTAHDTAWKHSATVRSVS